MGIRTISANRWNPTAHQLKVRSKTSPLFADETYMQLRETCGSEITPIALSCADGGAPADNDATITVVSNPPIEAAATTLPASQPASSTSSYQACRYEARYLPGALIAGRYRIIALLGHGGMGEVYRADDLGLGLQVALKFLPETPTDEQMLERFRNEVPTARRISHPNVCRVFDIGQTGDQAFFSMEYIDGEDLGCLLRRIGRLPGDKASEIARKICAGLAAAHSKGVLHRDLKPANIMLDGRGEILIMDFGLAGVAHQIEDCCSGTPAYMAPEQLAGLDVTERSDIYSLGLVLYELFTGKPAFDGRTLDEIVRMHNGSGLSRPSRLLKDLDPSVERIILCCLETDAANRPESALAVAAALPGGDPLADALSAGETPSPQLLAAAGEIAGLSMRACVACVAAALLGLIAFYAIGVRISAIQHMDLNFSQEILAQKAREIAQQLGYAAPAADTADGFDYQSDFLEYLRSKSAGRPDWNTALRGRPAPLQYWLRLSPRELVANRLKDNLLLPGIVDRDDPPPILSGMAEISLAPQGRLAHWEAIPPELQSRPYNTALTPPDWKPLFAAAGLDMTQFQPSEPLWNSLASADNRAAWTGSYPETQLPLRVEAGAWRSKPVYFKLIGPWTQPARMPSTGTSDTGQYLQVALAFGGFALLVGAALIAWRNYRHQKTDLPGAWRLGIAVFCLEMTIWLCETHFVPTLSGCGLLVLAMSASFFFAGITCTVYLALDPYVRRHWPHAILSWTRALAGKLTDPLVGRDLLYGIILGLIWAVFCELTYLAQIGDGGSPNLGSTAFLMGTRRVLGAWLWLLANSLQATLACFFLMFILRVLLRKPWLAALAFVALWAAIKLQGNPHWIREAPGYLVVYGVVAFMILRFGYITLATGIFVVDLLLNIPITTNPAAWYMSGSLFVLTTIAAMTLWGGFIALGRQEFFSERLFE
jgi:hypothetical protein